MSIRPASQRARRALIAITALAIALAVTACGDGDDSRSASGAATTTSSATPAGLQPRPLLPPLVNGEANPCLPLCAEGKDEPGRVPLGRYQTTWFFGAYMTLELKRAWTIHEDSTSELKLMYPGDPDYGVGFALDLDPVKDTEPVEGVPNTVASKLRWLRSNDDLTVSKPTPATIGDLPAMAVDVAISKTATNEDPDCPGKVCVLFWTFEQWSGWYGIAGNDVNRFYFADVEYNGTKHVFIVWAEGKDRAHLAKVAPAVEELLDTVKVPAHAA
jgi:hypothetical protein